MSNCDLSKAQLNALSNSKGGWWLTDDDYYFFPDSDLLLREWNGFHFYKVDEAIAYPEFELTLAYLVTPGGFFLALSYSAIEVSEDELKNPDFSEKINNSIQEIIDDAITTLLKFPESQGQLKLELVNAIS